MARVSPAPEPRLRAALYLRVSTGGQEQDGTSLDTQEQRCRAYAAERGYTVDEAHVYRETHSGVELWQRPRLTVLRDALRRREVDVVIAYAIDRLARDPVHLGVIITEAEHAHVAVAFVSEPLDDSPEGQLIRFVRGYAAKVEHEKIRERSMRGKRARVESGQIHRHGTELYGYRRDHQAGVRCVYEPEAAVVRDVYRWVAEEGLQIRAVIRRLNDAGVPPPSAGKLTFKDPTRAPRWGKGAIQRMLRDPAYTGEGIAWRWQGATKEHGRTERPESDWVRLPEGSTPALVPPERWAAVQARLDGNRGEAARNQRRPYLLRGMVVCGMCRRPMRSSPEHGKRIYRCSSRETPSGHCGSMRVLADAVERWAWEEIAARLRDPATIAAEVRRAREAGPDPTLLANREATERALVKIEQRQQRLLQRYAASDDDSFPWELVEQEIARAQREKQQLQGTLEEIDHQLAQQRVAVDQLDALTSYCKRVAARLDTFDFTDRRLALEALGVRVVANGWDWRLSGSIPLGEPAGVASQSS